MAEALAGTGTMLRLGLRRDRWLLPAWIVAFAVMVGSAAAAGGRLYPDTASRIEAARSLNAAAAMVALFGRVYDPSSLGALALIKYTAFMTAILAVVMVFVTIRHTRGDEEVGRLELLAGGRLGRHAPLGAALLLSFGASVALGLASSLALMVSGLPAAGSLAFGSGWTVTGMAFSAVAGVTAQLTTGARTAVGIGAGAIGVTYLFRAVGDLADPGPSALSWISPIGWNQQVRAFAGDRWWVLVLPLALCAALVPLAFALRSRRDLGAGLGADRPGPARGSILGVDALAIRLHGRSSVAWVVAFAVFGVVIGSLVGTAADLLNSPGAQDVIRKLGGQQALEDAFLSAELAVMGVLAGAYAVAVLGRLRSEETAGHLEVLLATSTTRLRWALSHVAVAVGGATALTSVAGITSGVGAALVLHDGTQVGRATIAALAQAPAVWVLAAIVVLVFGWAPRLTSGSWGLYTAFIALGELGPLWHAPRWVMGLSPFHHAPLLPVGARSLPSVLGLVVVAAVLGTAGLLGWRRRDLSP